jgi:DNA-binding NtrC family response regulator
MNKRSSESDAPLPDLLVVDDDPSVIELIRLYGRERGFSGVEAASTADDGLAALRSGAFKLVVLDLGLPDRPGGSALAEFAALAGETPIAVVTADDRVSTAVACMREGAFDFLEKPVSPARLLSLFAHTQENYRYRRLLKPSSGRGRSPAFARIVTESPLMDSLFQAVERLAPSPMPVLVAGESGTGKELIARAVHDLSGRGGAFVPVNVAGLDGTLFSDVLFGHAKGAYTGAEGVRAGLVKRAEGGTLFMDEIGDLNTEIQVKLLRFLQDGEYYPLGADRPEKSACRVVLATHVDLAEAVRSGRFRADLYYRLMVLSVVVPPLRDRLEDLPRLVAHFVGTAAADLRMPAPAVDPEFIAALEGYAFPGNIRELSAIVYGAVAAGSGAKLPLAYARSYLERRLEQTRTVAAASCPEYPYAEEGPFPTLAALEERHIREALRRTDGNQSAAAALLGVAQSTVSRYLKRAAPGGA